MSERKRKSNDSCASSPPKKPYQRQQTFLASYASDYKFLRASKRGETFAFCAHCMCDFSIAHGGRNDIERHKKSAKHKTNEKSSGCAPALRSFLTSNADSPQRQLELNVTRAEAIMAHVIAEVNLPLSAADTLNKAVKMMFPDSKIAQNFHCARNKTTCFIRELGTQAQCDLVSRMKSGPFTLSTDGSNDDKSKQFPLVIRSIDAESGRVTSELLSVPICSGSATGQNIFNLIEGEIEKRGLPWENCLAFGSDNANVMVGRNKGVFAFMKQKNVNMHLSGCTLHLVHIAAEKAADTLPAAVDDILIDIFHYFKKSSKRQDCLGEYQELHNTDQEKMLKHVCTRWLSIDSTLFGETWKRHGFGINRTVKKLRCLARLLKNWAALKDFFKAEKAETKSSGSKAVSTVSGPSTSSSTSRLNNSNVEGKVDKILTFLRSPTCRLYCLFLQYAHTVYSSVLIAMQADEPKIHVLRRSLHIMIRNLLVKFVKPSALTGKSVDTVQYKLPYNHKPDMQLIIGDEASTFIRDKSKNGLTDSRIEEFYRNVKRYYIAAVDYLTNKLPLNDPVLTQAEVADVQLRATSSQSDLCALIERFPSLLLPVTCKDKVIEEFCLYQSTELTCFDADDRIDDVWTKIGNMKNDLGETMFQNLASVMKGILTIPHSSAHCERIFSCVRKNRTEQRACLSDDTLEALLVLKSKPGTPCDQGRSLSNETLSHLKGAYYRSLKESGQ